MQDVWQNISKSTRFLAVNLKQIYLSPVYGFYGDVCARYLRFLRGSSSFRTICLSVQESYCHMTKSCRSHFLNPHLDCNLDVIFAEVGNVHLEFFKLTPFSRKLSRDRRSQTIGCSQVHMAITLTITMVCRHNISFLQNSSHHCHPIDFP